VTILLEIATPGLSELILTFRKKSMKRTG